MPNRKLLAILGSTGSIGRNTLEIVAQHPDRFNITALSAHTNVDLLSQQIRRFKPRIAVVSDGNHADQLRRLLGESAATRILIAQEGLCEAVAADDVETVVTAVVGAAGLVPTLAAIAAGKDIALANKETMVVAGELVTARAKAKGVAIHPVDSEHSAIYQCLAGNRRRDLEKILLTGSGGPFRTRPVDTFTGITVADALRHPNWQMGAKITIDSATMMNKGLEVIEAKWLFDLTTAQIEVVIHPQSIIHSMVAFKDGAVMAQLGIPDMKAAIAYALSCPERLSLDVALPAFTQLGQLTFEPPDFERFPCLALAFDALEKGGTAPAVLNAANEAAVGAFLEHRIGYTAIAATIGNVLSQHQAVAHPDLDALLAADRWARQTAKEIMQQ